MGKAGASARGTVKRASTVPKGKAFSLCERNDEDDFLAGEIVRPRADAPALPAFSLWNKREIMLKVPKICYTVPVF
jgi:hypothetical protein